MSKSKPEYPAKRMVKMAQDFINDMTAPVPVKPCGYCEGTKVELDEKTPCHICGGTGIDKFSKPNTPNPRRPDEQTN